jgi:hypothetical protein
VTSRKLVRRFAIGMLIAGAIVLVGSVVLVVLGSPNWFNVVSGAALTVFGIALLTQAGKLPE